MSGPLAVAMKDDEIAMLARFVVPGITYLEFGSGGSTSFALERGVALCHAVESDAAWVARLRERPELREAEARGRLVLHAIDIGPVLDWGMPANTSSMAQWPAYYLTVWERLGKMPDVILIDGRFRTACGLVALALTGPETSVLMHDFFDPLPVRKNYRSLLDVADVVERATTLVHLRRKDGVAPHTLMARLAGVWTDFA